MTEEPGPRPRQINGNRGERLLMRGEACLRVHVGGGGGGGGSQLVASSVKGGQLRSRWVKAASYGQLKNYTRH